MRDVEGGRARIIDYWRTVEMFGPQRVDPVSHVNRVFRVEDGKPLPWEQRHPLMAQRRPPDTVWRHTVYLGIYQLDDVLDVLEPVFPSPPEAYDERRPGASAAAALEVSDDGRPLLGSETLSSCAWATGRALRPGPQAPGWLAGLDRGQTRLRERCEELFALDEDDDPPVLGPDDLPVGRPLTPEDLRAGRRAVVDGARSSRRAAEPFIPTARTISPRTDCCRATPVRPSSSNPSQTTGDRGKQSDRTFNRCSDS